MRNEFNNLILYVLITSIIPCMYTIIRIILILNYHGIAHKQINSTLNLLVTCVLLQTLLHFNANDKPKISYIRNDTLNPVVSR